MSKEVTCILCNKIYNLHGFSIHIKHYHNIELKQYYDQYLKKLTDGLCKICNKPTKFLGYVGYRPTCSPTCAARYNQFKREQTNLIKYGTKNPASNTQIRNKISTTIKSNECQQKIKNTCLQKYGVEHITQNKQIYDRIKQTCLNKYGVTSTLKLDSVRQKCNEKLNTKEVQDKIKRTKKDKYGNENYNNRDKANQTNLDRYGKIVKHQTGSTMFEQSMLNIYGTNWRTINSNKSINTKNLQTSKFEKENNCTNIKTLIKLYGQGWLAIKHTLNLLYFKDRVFVSNTDLIKITSYLEESLQGFISHKEIDLYNYIKEFYKDKIIQHTRVIINPKELDIYLPTLQLAVEFNGVRWHSYELGTKENYHLEKSLLCKNKNIRLIHIYEFEDLEHQKCLLKNLILGTDLYNKKDFNKNNLSDTIPIPEIIYKDQNYTIYGAGKLY